MQNVANPATKLVYIKQAVELPNLKLNKIEGETAMTEKEYTFHKYLLSSNRRAQGLKKLEPPMLMAVSTKIIVTTASQTKADPVNQTYYASKEDGNLNNYMESTLFNILGHVSVGQTFCLCISIVIILV